MPSASKPVSPIAGRNLVYQNESYYTNVIAYFDVSLWWCCRYISAYMTANAYQNGIDVCSLSLLDFCSWTVVVCFCSAWRITRGFTIIQTSDDSWFSSQGVAYVPISWNESICRLFASYSAIGWRMWLSPPRQFSIQCIISIEWRRFYRVPERQLLLRAPCIMSFPTLLCPTPPSFDFTWTMPTSIAVFLTFFLSLRFSTNRRITVFNEYFWLIL